ncbi:MAG: tripartite tricarboxylate transporter substrate binding protein [Curvibacter lanceolatus]|jgi:tripartite-type tricarboxylate transporter receptor subunit TctC|uniref:Bug family tripartite tricarboxylate transporter substrate binding protein n=1 Tax=Curvibacter lanceolatus TaxID=86182 RepID=UPI0023538E34|nr:tripartite tricarboxylate transporter substrate binding protein [Curvibacter lanceolatus]MBV5294454.1 tripartite tricarboxylate transporter substrate binding protein [Curvibacter lanceolatus]
MPSYFSRPRRVLLALASLGPLLWGAPAQAQGGGQPIRLVVGYAAGGPVDATARLFAPALSKELGQPVVVENRPGAAGSMGGDAVAKATPNGLLLYFGASPTLTISPHILKSMPFDVSKDLTAIAPLVSYTNVLVINKDQPFKTLPELVAYARANPGKLAYGSAGMGASNHLSGELFALRAGIKLTHVPYKGNAPAMTDVIGGQLSMMFDIIGSARNYISTQRVRPLAVTSRERNASLPEVPTMVESGIADYDVGGWYGLYGPARLAPELVGRLNEATRRALAQDELKAKLIEQGYDLWTGSPQLLTERAARELALWGTVAKGIQVE